LYENDRVIGFLDINPINPGHALVLPKNHYATLFDTPPEELHACIEAAKLLAEAIHRAVGAAGLNLLQNNFRAAGQLIDHVHFHLIPRKVEDGFITSWRTKTYGEGGLENVLARIKAEL
jgi:histidine triad (HIT) family protein